MLSLSDSYILIKKKAENTVTHFWVMPEGVMQVCTFPSLLLTSSVELKQAEEEAHI